MSSRDQLVRGKNPASHAPSRSASTAEPIVVSTIAPARTLFQEEWWLDAASGGRYETIDVIWDGRKVGSQSFVRDRRRGLRHVCMPPYTRTLGPVLNLPEAKAAQRHANIRRVVAELQQLLPPHEHFYQMLDPCDESAFAFSLAGCEVSARFTFRVQAGESGEVVFDRIAPKIRRLIRASERTCEVQAHVDFDRFRKTCDRDHAPDESTHDFATMARIFERSVEASRTTILSVVDEHGADLASAILVWGGGVTYYWNVARDRQLAGGGANSLLLWRSMEFARSHGMAFDFDGYKSTSAGVFLSLFGVTPLIRPSVVMTRGLGYPADAMRAIYRSVRAHLHRG
jgi:hypothetical protein